jgi:hypothetical protein
VEPQINCPSAGANINVASGSGSGGGGTICVSGIVIGEEAVKKFQESGFFVAVAVFACNQGSGSNQCPLPPKLPPANAVFATINGTTWCATGVPVPSSSSAGDLMIVYVWIVFPTNSGIIVTSAPVGQEFNSCQGNPHATDCCSSLLCLGSGSSPIVKVIQELRNKPVLQVTVPDGIHAGHYSATAVAYLKWCFRVGKHEYVLEYCSTSGLKIQGPSHTISAEAIESEPFAAIFAGKIFGSSGEVLVTIA